MTIEQLENEVAKREWHDEGALDMVKSRLRRVKLYLWMADRLDMAMRQVPTNQTPIKGQPTKAGFKVESCALNVVIVQYTTQIGDIIQRISRQQRVPKVELPAVPNLTHISKDAKEVLKAVHNFYSTGRPEDIHAWLAGFWAEMASKHPGDAKDRGTAELCLARAHDLVSAFSKVPNQTWQDPDWSPCGHSFDWRPQGGV
jgi:hypothetical protein